ncbi:hypothetical protein FACS1894127_4210 [Clostridia bacterium]|nr:hypothetical protein FACS1894127_4210 [Clostridia bacterium]
MIKKRHFPIRLKIVLSIYAVLFPVLIVAEGLIYYNNYNEIMKERERQYRSVVESIDQNISYLEQDMLDIAVYFSVASDIQRLLMADPEDTSKDLLFWGNMTSVGIIENILAVKTKITTMIIYPENGLKYFSTSRDKSVYAPSIEEIRKLELYRRAVEANGDVVWARINTNEKGLYIKNSSDKIVMCRELFDLSKRHRLGFLSMSIDVGGYENICKNAMVQDNEKILILNSEGSELFSYGDIGADVLAHIKASDTLRGWTGSVPYEHEGYYIFAAHRTASNEWIYYLSAKSSWEDWVRSGLVVPVLLALALLLSTIPLSALASRIISRPLMTLYKSMNEFKGGDFSQQVIVDTKDEIAELADTFNKMVLEIRDLIDRNYVMVLMEKESELNALQAQINPHFLYNALDSLYWQALDSKQEHLAEDILSLSELFRVLLSNGKSEITVERELGIVRHYLNIQKMRFDKKLDYSIEADSGILDHHIPKLILQPFVENAITHGLENKTSWGFVMVTGELRDGKLCFMVRDNGTGMSKEVVDQILTCNEDTRYASQRVGSYAIRNVKERMQLRYGEMASLSIHSVPGEGTSVYIEVPAEVSAR